MNKTKSLDWLDGENIRPYVFVREDNRSGQEGARRFDLDWFPFKPLYFNALQMDQVGFANQILFLESAAFEKAQMAMPRWVFYDCAIIPGFVAGFAHRTRALSGAVRAQLKPDESQEWTPISLFIIIPTMAKQEWVAHNLSSVNSILPAEQRFYGLGFLTKAFGLWQANIRVCIGVTQWQSPAIKLHSHYGAFEILTAYTPVHNYPTTLTYRLKVDPKYWALFFTQRPAEDFKDLYRPAGFKVDPQDSKSLMAMQARIEGKEGPFFLDSWEIRTQPLNAALTVYRPA